MTRYRSRSVEVSAFQFDTDGEHRCNLPEGIHGIPSPGADNWNYEGCTFTIQTVHGVEPIEPGDWIVITDDGGWRKCCREAFEQGFEQVTPKSKLLLSTRTRAELQGEA